jgi:iron complex transport system substrate-binding protein
MRIARAFSKHDETSHSLVVQINTYNAGEPPQQRFRTLAMTRTLRNRFFGVIAAVAQGRGTSRRFTISLLLLVLMIFPAGCVPAYSQQRIADTWYAHNSVVIMLGSADHIVATVVRPSAYPWMYRVAPSLQKATSIYGAAINAEELRKLNVDLVFTANRDATATALERAGLHVVPVGFQNFDSLMQCIDQTAHVLGTPLAARRANAYRQYLAQTLSDVRRSAAKIPIAQRPRVLHVLSLDPLRVDGENTIIDEWIKAAGGRNAAEGQKGAIQEIPIEQVLAWQPDVIILEANAGTIEASPRKELLSRLAAVQHHRVYRNPAGVFPWDRYGPEVALQLRWTASVLQTEPQTNDKLVQETRDFCKMFFSYSLSTADAQRILQGLPPEASH